MSDGVDNGSRLVTMVDPGTGLLVYRPLTLYVVQLEPSEPPTHPSTQSYSSE
jgi:hypothetical protein